MIYIFRLGSSAAVNKMESNKFFTATVSLLENLKLFYIYEENLYISDSFYYKMIELYPKLELDKEYCEIYDSIANKFKLKDNHRIKTISEIIIIY
jgi:hypothetical protein